MNALAPIATEIAEAVGEPFKAERIERHLAAREVAKHNAIRNGTAWGLLHLLQDEILATAGKVRNARRAGSVDALRSHTVALFALLRVRKEMRAKYPEAKPYWRSMGEAA